MHLRNVEIFCDVVAQRSFSKSAESNNVSQSSASQAVHTLEKRLGCRLIDRSKRPLEPTAAGQVYFEGCRTMLDSFRKIEDHVQRMEHRVAGRLRVAAIYSVGLLQMDEYLQRYRQSYPDVDVRVDYLHPDEVYARIDDDSADLGLVSFPRDGGEIGSIPWQEQRMVLVVAPHHALAAKSHVAVHELEGEEFVGFRAELTVRRQIERWLKRAKVAVNVVHEFDNIEIIKRAVEIGSGVTILPAPTVRREVETGSLAAIPFEDVAWYRPLGIIHKRQKTLTTAVSKFVDLLHDHPEAFPNSQHPAFRGDGDQATEIRNGHDKTDRPQVVQESIL